MTMNQDDVVEVAARMEFNGTDDVVNVFQFQKVDAIPTVDADGVDDLINILEVFYTLINAVFTTLLLYRDLRVTNVTQSIVLGTFPWPNLVAGLDANDPTPPGVSALINWNTGVARVSPRKYLGVLAEDSVQAQAVWEPGVVAVLALMGANLIGTLSKPNSDWQYGFLSPKTLSFEPVISATVSNIPAYQRRRKQGRGS